jgi:O-Antigen ligase
MDSGTPLSPPSAAGWPARALQRAGVGLADATSAAAGLACVAIFLIWFQKGAGYDVVIWIPGALLIIGLLATLVIATGGALALSRAQAVALVAFGCFVAWSYASISWAGVKGDAWDGANRNLLYFAVFALFLLLPWTPKAANVVLTAYAGGVTVLAAAAIAHVSTTVDDALFIRGRLTYPTGYGNANVAVFLIAFWIAVVLGTRRHQPVLVRGLALGAAAFLAQAALLVQTRVTLVAVPLVGLVLVALGPDRLRTAAGLALSLMPIAFTWDIHLKVYQQAEDEPRFLETAMQPSARAMAATAVAVALVGLAWAVIDRRTVLSRRVTRTLTAAAVCVAIAGSGVAAVVIAKADARGALREAWYGTDAAPTTDTRFRSLRSERYDIWRVALDRWRDKPVHGIGADNFAVDYLRVRATGVSPKYPHSLELGVLSQLGIVGVLFFGVFAATASVLAAPRASDPPIARTVRAAALAVWLYWLVHASFDWFLEIPGVSAPAFAFLGAAVALGGKTAVRAPTSRPASIAAVTTLALTACVVVTLGAPWLAARHVDSAIGRWTRDPAGAFELLERARALNPLSSEPDLVAGAIASKRDDRDRMRQSFMRALERNPNSWYAHLELGLTHSVDGRRTAALRELRRALTLNPREDILHDVLEELEAGKTVSPRSVDKRFAEGIRERTR